LFHLRRMRCFRRSITWKSFFTPKVRCRILFVPIAHAQFETIHPFVDGNGRLGRLLITFMLCEHKILRKPLLYLSYFLKKNRSEYYDRLHAIRDSGQWEPWLRFFLRGIAEVAEEATATALKIVRLREDHRRLVGDNLGRSAGRAMTLLETLYRQPVVSVSMVSDISKLTFQGASDIAKQFCRLGILEESTGNKRYRLFAYKRYLALLGEPRRRKAKRSGLPTKTPHTLAASSRRVHLTTT
jgi:Fic family protein